MKQKSAGFGTLFIIFDITKYKVNQTYLDINLQIDIQVKDGKATIRQSQISEEKANELFDKFYK